MKPQPVAFDWKQVEVISADGEAERVMAMVPLNRYANVCKRQFGDGGEHVLEPTSERSMASHSQFFAAINDHFKNLPERVQARWPSATHFRRWLLIEAGHFDEKEFECDSQLNARRLAGFIRTEDEYARIHVRGTVVIVRRAKSQAIPAMKAEEFKITKRDVLDLAEQLTGVSRGQAMKNAGRSA